MATLPLADRVVIDERKVTDYLLSESHPVGRSKSVFFKTLGFRPDNWRSLRDGLLEHARTAQVVAEIETEFGRKYIIEGLLVGPTGAEALVRAVWFTASGQTVPRLVTAYRVSGGKG
jgi:hypothetical protein